MENKKRNTGKFATLINCMDGRAQIPPVEWIKNNYKVDFVDVITLPGVNRALAECKDKGIIESIKRSVEISIERHGSMLITVCGHYDCAGNAAGKGIQIKHLRDAIKVIESWDIGVPVIGLWINKNWNVKNVK